MLGVVRLSKTFFSFCITTDPSFSMPYLHMGEWFLMRQKMAAAEGESAEFIQMDGVQESSLLSHRFLS